MSERAVLAGGCFWGMQDLIRKMPGVEKTRVGYTGGDVKNATYRNHGTHAEGIEIIFDPNRISYRRLLEFFFQIHDPTTPNRQGNDRGMSYRSAIYYTDDQQRQTALDTIADVNASGLWPGKVVTEVEPVGDFWEAEPEHQDYLERIPHGYTCHFARPDWVLSRQRAWGVPICVFADADGNVLLDEAVSARIIEAFEKEGADAWFAEGARQRFLGNHASDPKWIQVTDILDVWFDSGCTHVFTLEDRPDLKWPADVYLEGSDQHRGWFHSSLLESCATRGRAPYDAVITHGFTMAEDGRKMSKSLNNQVFPQDVMKESGADILRLWVMNTDYWEDQRLGKTVIKTNIDAYRKLRNTIRWMLGTLAHDGGEAIDPSAMPELERLMLHRLSELDQLVRTGYDNFDFKRISRALTDFANIELSAFYFDIRKDALYCDAPSSLRRRASLQVIRTIFDCLVTWLAPMLPFTMEEAWLSHKPDAESVHLEQFPEVPGAWRDEALAAKWKKIRTVRRVVTGALEIERREKRIGSSLEAAPVVYITDPALVEAVGDSDFAEICITSGVRVETGEGPGDAFRIDEVGAVAVVPALAEGMKCARSWRITDDVGSDPEYPDVSARDAAALHELKALGRL